MLKESVELDVDGLKFVITIEGNDDIAVLKRRNEIFRFILNIPEVINLTDEYMRQLEIDDLERSLRKSD